MDMRAGDCLFIPSFYLHYVRSWGRNVAASYMWQTHERYDGSDGGACADGSAAGEAARAGVTLAEHDIIWDFPGPGAPGDMEHSRVKMGFPNWKLFIAAIVDRGGAEGVQEDCFVRAYRREINVRKRHSRALFRELAEGAEDGALGAAYMYSDAVEEIWRKHAFRAETDGELDSF